MKFEVMAELLAAIEVEELGIIPAHVRGLMRFDPWSRPIALP
jgi:hypothetical protein